MTMAATSSAHRASFPREILAQLEAFCAGQRTGKIEIDILHGQVMEVKGIESWFNARRSVDKTKTSM